MRAILISIGDELACGLTVNTNSAWLAQQLSSIGVTTLSHVTVPDQLAPIVSAIRHACSTLKIAQEAASASRPGEPPARPAAHGVLLISGGLGPTLDDLTRQALADALNEQLVEDPDAVLQIEAWFQARGRQMSPSNRLQAMRPTSATIIENIAGTAPGLHATTGHLHHESLAKNPVGGDAGAGGSAWGGSVDIFVMPGVPREMKEMFTRWVLPLLVQKAAALHPDPIITQATKINTFGMGESILGEKIKDLMARNADAPHKLEGPPTLSVGTTVNEGIVSVRIYATGTRSQVAVATQQVRTEIYERLAPVIFSENDEPLEAAVSALLRQRKYTLATAESCTGGMLAGMLTNIPGSSGYFLRGWVTYANAAKHDELAIHEDLIKEHGAVSEPVARAMAEGARRFAETEFALATTGIAGPEGGTPDKPVGTVYIALATPTNTIVRLLNLPGNRHAIRQRSAQWSLALLRWHLLGITPPA